MHSDIAIRDFAFLVSDLLFASYVSVADVMVLGLVSKRLIRFLDAQKTIAQVWLHKLAVSKKLKLSTLVTMRKDWYKIAYSLTTEQNLAIKESCALCFASYHINPNVRTIRDATIKVGNRSHMKGTVCETCSKNDSL